jgi:hypothetical protein
MCFYFLLTLKLQARRFIFAIDVPNWCLLFLVLRFKDLNLRIWYQGPEFSARFQDRLPRCVPRLRSLFSRPPCTRDRFVAPGFFSRREVLDLGRTEEGVFLNQWWTDGSRDEAAAGEAGSDHDLGCPHGCIQAHRQQMRSSEPSLSGLQEEWPQPREMFASGPGRHELCCLVVSFVNLSQSRVVYDRAFTYYTRFWCSFHVSSSACKAIKKCGRYCSYMLVIQMLK